MKRLLSTITLAALTLYSISGVFLCGIYLLQSDVIAEAFCVNPQQPSCHGKCHIAKLTTNEQEKNDTLPFVEINLEKPLLFHPVTILQEPVQSILLPPFSSLNLGPLLNGYPQSIDHPPNLLA